MIETLVAVDKQQIAVAVQGLFAGKPAPTVIYGVP
jgi:hypothetical protein